MCCRACDRLDAGPMSKNIRRPIISDHLFETQKIGYQRKFGRENYRAHYLIIDKTYQRESECEGQRENCYIFSACRAGFLV